MACLAISQTMPGLNAVNIAVLTGDKLRGVLGAIVAAVGLLIPGIAFVLVMGTLYLGNSNQPLANMVLACVGAAATGLLSAITYRLGRKQFKPFQIPSGRDCVLLFDEHFKLILGHGAAHHGPHRPHPFPSKELSTWFQHLFISP
jgi:chromate transport protein ChrA